MSHIVIIGGGIAGVSAAAQLASECQVTLLEAEKQLGYHATGRSAAMFLKDYGNAVVRALNHASEAELQDMNALSDRSMLLLGKTNEGTQFEAERADFNMQRITLDEAQSLFPILNLQTVGFAGFREQIFDLDTDLMLQTYLRRAKAAGASVLTDQRVRKIEYRDTQWSIETPSHTITADIMINAAGAWADQIAKMATVSPIGIQPFRRSFAQLAAPKGADMTSWPFVDGVGESWYAKPSAGKLLVSPSEEDPMPAFDAYADDMVIAEGLARFGEMVSTPITRPETSWAGLRSFAPDRALVIGQDANAPNFYWCAGQGGYGFQTAPAASQLLAALITGRAPKLPASIVTALSPRRFAPAFQD